MRGILASTIGALAKEFGQQTASRAITPPPPTAPVPMIPRMGLGTAPVPSLPSAPSAIARTAPPVDRSRMGIGQDFGGGMRPMGQRAMRAPMDPFARMSRDPFQAPDPPSTGGGWGPVTEVGGAWGALDAHNAEIANAAQQFGVPANLLKAMINRESSGNWERDNRIHYGLRGQGMLPFVGIFEDTAASWGLDFNAMVGNKQAQINGMATILRGLSEKYGGYENAAKVYFGGEQALNGGFVDEFGMDSNTYGTTAINDWKWLDQQAGYTGGGGSWGGDWSQSFGPGAQVHDWGEFGVESNNGYYDYGRQYGLNGTQHTGLDITGGWNTTYRSPVSGTVTCAGTGVGAGADGGGCTAFATMDGRGGAGRIEVQLDNGAVLIFGHSQGSFVKPGQRINVGDALGTIGWANSDHIHLEARVKDPSTPSGWRLVDPRTVLGGGGNWGGQREEVTGWRRWLR